MNRITFAHLLTVSLLSVSFGETLAQGRPGGPFNRNPTPGIAWETFNYQFVQQGTGDVLAVMDFDEFPATEISDIESFRFTAAGDAIWALGTSDLLSEFEVAAAVEIDSANGLSGLNLGQGLFEATTPPTPNDLTNYPGFLGANSIQLEFNATQLDLIDYQYNTSGGVGQNIVAGNWIQVPEPHSLALLALAVLSGRVIQLRYRTSIESI